MDFERIMDGIRNGFRSGLWIDFGVNYGWISEWIMDGFRSGLWMDFGLDYGWISEWIMDGFQGVTLVCVPGRWLVNVIYSLYGSMFGYEPFLAMCFWSRTTRQKNKTKKTNTCVCM